MSAIKLLDKTYRGFTIGYVEGLYGYRPAWRSSLENKWRESYVYADSFDDIEVLARQCIDFQYKESAKEIEIGRAPTIDELKYL